MQELSQWAPSSEYTNPLQTVVQSIRVDQDTGLSEMEVASRLESDGGNVLIRSAGVSPSKILLEQFKSSVVVLLLVAAVISSILNEYLQTVGIVAAVFINAAVGFVTEYRAKISLEKLSRLAGAVARVRRDNRDQIVPVGDLVRGDLVLLQAGDRVPADLKLVEAPALSVDESIMTGESEPVWKTIDGHGQWEPSVLFQGTSVASGRAKAIVIATGSATRLGALASKTSEIDDSATPLQLGLEDLGKQLSWLTVVICAVVAVIGVGFRGIDVFHMLETSIALAVAAIPEGLPVVATLALAVGIRRMVVKKALVRRLTAVETLGCTTIICTDKTGTLTQNKMMVNQIFTSAGLTEFGGSGYDPAGEVTGRSQEAERLLLASALCCDASLHKVNGTWQVNGDPTEGALLVAARKMSIDEHSLFSQFPRIVEIPFDLNRKRMSTVHSGEDGIAVFCKGSPEVVLPLCSHILRGDSVDLISEDQRLEFSLRNAKMANAGLRVLAVAQKQISEGKVCIDVANLESDLTLLGLVAMSDSLRPDIEESIELCKRAGIKILMLTGDQQRTADAIAIKVGINEVRARVTPEMKLDVVRELREQGHIVAMTGDGVNDAPALKQSNIGIAMGESGSDLARDASDLVITDDNFATIVSAIEEGRAIYSNIKRAIAYLLTASLSSVMVVAVGILFSKELLLMPLQILWLNLIMHVFPGIGLVMQRGTADAMLVPPRVPGQPLLDKPTVVSIFLRSTIVSTAAVMTPGLAHHGGTGATDSSIVLAVVSICLIMQSWGWLWDKSVNAGKGNFRIATILNLPMVVTSIVGGILVIAPLEFHPLSVVLQTQALDMHDWVVSLLVSFGTFVLTLVLSRIGFGVHPNDERRITERRMKDEAVSAEV